MQAPTPVQLNETPTHEFLSSTGEWYKCHYVRPTLILITDPYYPLPGISKYCRVDRNSTRVRVLP